MPCHQISQYSGETEGLAVELFLLLATSVHTCIGLSLLLKSYDFASAEALETGILSKGAERSQPSIRTAADVVRCLSVGAQWDLFPLTVSDTLCR